MLTPLSFAFDSGITAPLCERRRGEAHRRQGWVGGACPSAPLKARTAASDGHCTFTRAARSAGLNFAVILLSKALDVGRDHLIHRKRSLFPYEGKDLTPPKLGETSSAGRDSWRVRLRCRAICSRMFAARGDVSDSGIRQVRRLGWHLIHRGAVPLPLNRGRL